ncbi:MAG: VWA domain-containing protein [Pyrinomonadaceae bacterium]
MKKFAAVGLIIMGLSSIGLAQSGRKAAPTPVPIADNEQERQYSESTPTKMRQINSLPGLHSEGNTSKPELKPQTSIEDSKKEAETTGDDVGVLKIDNTLITIPVSIFDRNGLYIPNLEQSNFKIFEDEKEQEIAYFATSEKPFTVVLLLDTSPSTQYKIDEIQSAAIAFVNQLKAQDSVMVIEFDQGVHVLSDPTNNRQKLYKAIRRADFGNGTSLYDTVDYALRKKLSKIQGRKAIVLFTDGVDTTSYKNDYDSTLRQAEEADSLIFPIYYNTFFNNQDGVMSSPYPGSGTMSSSGTTSGEYLVGKKYLEDLAANTGGRVFQAESTNGGLTGAFEGIAEELRRQYNIGYYPPETGQAGQRKQIKVRVNRPNLVVRARDSYIVGGNAKIPATTSSKFNFDK